jgi:hypothetical protein
MYVLLLFMNMTATLGPQLWPLEDDPTGEALVTQRAEDLQFYRRALNTLVEIGVNLAFTVQQLEIHRKADISLSGSNTPEPPAVFSLAFERISRSVRRTIHLAERIGQPPKPAQPAKDRTHRRKRIIRAVEDTIERTTEKPDAERLNDEFQERLDTEEFDDDLETRPLADLIAEICSDLGVAEIPQPPRAEKSKPREDEISSAPSAANPHPSGKRRTPEDLKILAARAAALPTFPRPLPPPPT